MVMGWKLLPDHTSTTRKKPSCRQPLHKLTLRAALVWLTYPVPQTPGFSPAPPVEIIQVDKKGPTQAIEVGKEFTFTLTPAVKAGPVTTMTLTDTIDASTGVSFVRVSPNAGALLLAE